MSTKIKRIGTLVIVGLFLISTFGFTGLVIWQMAHGKDNLSQSKLEEEQLKNLCTVSQVEVSSEKNPKIYKTTKIVKNLEITDIKVGSGDAVKSGDCITVKYYGTLAKTGKKFDGNFDQAVALKLKLGAGAVIAGWDQGIVGMKKGGVRRLVIPANLAYGDQSPSTDIPPNSDLVFVVKLLSVEKQ